jgi:DNA-binding beta-propeller fold protein YncE
VFTRGLFLAALVASTWVSVALAAPDSAPISPAPAGIAVDSDGNVYVSDYALDRVVKFASDGTLLSQWGTSGAAAGQFSAPFGIAVDDHTLYVVDQLNSRVQKFATDGTVLGAWGAAGAGSGEFRTPFGVAVGGGRVYVADFGNDRVQVFASDGSAVSVIGGRGSGDGQFLRPAGVAVDHDGSLYITDHFNDRVQRFSSEGRFQVQLGTASGASAAPVLSAPTVSASLSASPQATAVTDVQLSRPEGIALDRDGGLWVADYGRDRMVKLAPDGHLVLALGARGSGAGEFLGPKGVAVDAVSGRVYVADTGNARIQRLAPDGTPEAAWQLPGPASAPAPPTPTAIPGSF